MTGGNRGIGYEICKQLAHKGKKVLLTSRRQNKGLCCVGHQTRLCVHALLGVNMICESSSSGEKATAKLNEEMNRHKANYQEVEYHQLDVTDSGLFGAELRWCPSDSEHGLGAHTHH